MDYLQLSFLCVCHDWFTFVFCFLYSPTFDGQGTYILMFYRGVIFHDVMSRCHF